MHRCSDQRGSLLHDPQNPAAIALALSAICSRADLARHCMHCDLFGALSLLHVMHSPVARLARRLLCSRSD